MLDRELAIRGRTISHAQPPYVIAEAGSNFCQNYDTARRLIDIAAEAGADAVKFQLFRADALYPDGGEMYDIFKSIELDAEWLPGLSAHAAACGVAFLASAFDFGSVEALEAIQVPAYKVASSETVNLPLLHRILETRKPVFVSTGMCDRIDVEAAVALAVDLGNTQFVPMQCASVYPAELNHCNLAVIETFREAFGGLVGFSDHTLETTAAIAAVALGARVIEKHFTHDKTAEGPDHFYALEPHELAAYVQATRDAHAAIGSAAKDLLPEERSAGRRDGLYVTRRITAGETIRPEDIVVRRPCLGMRARYFDSVAGRAVAKVDIEEDRALTWDLIAFS